MSVNSEASGESNTFQRLPNAQTSSAAAHRIAQSPADFSAWAALVNLNPNPLDGEKLPELLRKQVEDSRLVPSWMFELHSPEYKVAQRFFGERASLLVFLADKELKKCPSPDEELSSEIEHALDDILRASQHVHLQFFIPPPTEADRRRPIDQLNEHAWHYEGNAQFLYRSECHVQLPQPKDYSFLTARADSAVFIQLKVNLDMEGSERQACCTLVHRDSYRSILHWANEFKRDADEKTSERQVWMAMVSGIYQRRALGFKDHYVYGTAHHSRNMLNVFAGGWTDKTSQDGNLSKDAKITLYKLGTFNMSRPPDMVRFYNLMRLSRHCALKYKMALEAVTTKSIINSLMNDKGLGSWPPEFDSRSHPSRSKSGNSGAKRPRLSSVQEEYHDSAALPANAMSGSNHSTPPHATSTDQCVHVVGVDDPLKRQFVDILSRNEEWVKVHGYLASSLHEQYDYQVEEINDQVGDSSGHGPNHSAQAAPHTVHNDVM
ncbi:unnamed protein product [Rhizoctonia solani]|uniref:Uncharacterized protein n=1 Tax=Rhizoctonia solani TaxID=456999 RepID=A0A8H3GKV8_9AGAM|nr:unnamed protein product [Rhizoctonia solani]CAE6505166.1 unnamed protein product [Rhizoctonia solani]